MHCFIKRSENISKLKKSIFIQKPDYYASQFDFNQIFDQCSDQETIYLNVGLPILKDAQKGISSNLLVYGAQGSGKTYTMFGTFGSLFSLKQGLISIDCGLAIRMIYELYTQKSLLELKIYIIDNEKIINHLNSNCQLKWIDLAKQLCEVIQNLTDSIIHIIVEIKTNSNSKIKIIQIGSLSKLNQGSMTTHNKSIFTLHRCIQCQLDYQKQRKLIYQKTYIPFRESKLTNLLSNSFQGFAELKIILCLSPTKYDDALGTLQFGQLFQQIKIVPQHQKTQSLLTLQQTQSQQQMNEYASMTTMSQNPDFIPLVLHNQRITELTDKYEAIIDYLQKKIIKLKIKDQ